MLTRPASPSLPSSIRSIIITFTTFGGHRDSLSLSQYVTSSGRISLTLDFTSEVGVPISRCLSAGNRQAGQGMREASAPAEMERAMNYPLVLA